MEHLMRPTYPFGFEACATETAGHINSLTLQKIFPGLPITCGSLPLVRAASENGLADKKKAAGCYDNYYSKPNFLQIVYNLH